MDISKETFENIDFSESVLVFSCPRILEGEVTFQVWGATLLTNWDWPNTLPLPAVDFDARKTSLYVSGFGDIHINGAVGGELSVTLYSSRRLHKTY
jgi:hypothetical protein